MTLPVLWRATVAPWRARLASLRQRAARNRHVLTSAALVAAGALGGLGGGALVGRWCLGLVLIAESAGAVWWGLQRDDGAGRVPEGHTVPEILEKARHTW